MLTLSSRHVQTWWFAVVWFLQCGNDSIMQLPHLSKCCGRMCNRRGIVSLNQAPLRHKWYLRAKHYRYSRGCDQCHDKVLSRGAPVEDLLALAAAPSRGSQKEAIEAVHLKPADPFKPTLYIRGIDNSNSSPIRHVTATNQRRENETKEPRSHGKPNSKKWPPYSATHLSLNISIQFLGRWPSQVSRLSPRGSD